MTTYQDKLAHYPKTVSIKGGEQVTVRPMEAQDFDRVRNFFCALPRSARLFLRDDVTRPEVLAGWFANLDYRKKLPIMALVGDAVVGHALLDGEQRAWSPHIAEIRVVVAEEYRKRAVGTILARELFDQAAGRGYEKVVAQVMDTQAAARTMLERLGFTVEAELRRHVKDLDGAHHNLLLLSCTIEDGWAKMEELLEDFSPWVGWQ